MAKDKNLSVKKPPEEPQQSLQGDLFTSFLKNPADEVSNTIDFWDSIPKYHLTTAQIDARRTESGHADPVRYSYLTKSFQGEDTEYTVEIQPALIKQEDGSYKAFFPTFSESKIEEVLRKILAEQQPIMHDAKDVVTWVRFSYSMIRRELKRVKRERTYKEIKHSLDIMSKCVLTVWEGKTEIYKGAILQDYCSVDRETYLDNNKALHIARLPVFISYSINTLAYRQFNYGRIMSIKEQLSVYLFKRLVNRYTYADLTNSHKMTYSDIKRNSGLLQQGRESDNRKKITSSLEEMKNLHIISQYTATENKDSKGKIVDVVYEIHAAYQFIKEQKAANKRLQNAKYKIEQAKYNSVHINAIKG